MIIQLSAVPKADKSIIIAVKCKAAYKRRMLGFPRIWLARIIFRSFGLCERFAVSARVCVPVYASLCTYGLIVGAYGSVASYINHVRH